MTGAVTAEKAADRASLDERRYRLERKKLALEVSKYRNESRSLARQIGVVVTLTATAVTIIVSTATILIQQKAATTNAQLANDVATRQWHIESSRLVTQVKDLLYSKSEAERNLGIITLKSALPHAVYNSLFRSLSLSTEDWRVAHAFRSAQDIRPTWPEGTKFFGEKPKYTPEAKDPGVYQNPDGGFTLVASPCSSRIKATATRLIGDEYQFVVAVLSRPDSAPIESVVFIPEHPAFIMSILSTDTKKSVPWITVRATDGSSEFRYNGRFPVDRLKIAVHVGTHRCEQTVDVHELVQWTSKAAA